MSVVIQLVSAFAGSLGFALLFNIRGKRVFPAALGGMISWGAYLLMGITNMGDVASYLAASVILTLYSDIMAHRMKSPATVFLVSAAIPLIPGGMLYSTMRSAIEHNWNDFFYGSLKTLMLSMAIAGGILFAMTMMSVWKRSAALVKENRAQKQQQR